jgi:2'-5' RNA ligase
MDAFEEAWQRESAIVESGKGEVDIGLGVGRRTSPPIATVVTRLEPKTSVSVQRAIGEVASSNPGHYIYPVSDIHLTLIDVSLHLRHASHEAIAATVDRCLRMTDPFRLDARGLGLFRTCAFVQLWDQTHALRRVRMRLADALGDLTGQPSKVNDLAFANVMRFLEIPDPAIVNALRSWRSHDFGSFEVREAELVLTDKFLSAAATERLTAFELKNAQ